MTDDRAENTTGPGQAGGRQARGPGEGNRRRCGWWLLAALVLHVLPFATRPALIGGDEPHFALMAHSLAVDHDLELGDDYAAVAAGSNAAGRARAGTELERHLRPYRGREVFAHPLGLPALAAPALWLLAAIAPGAAPDLVLALLTLSLTFAGLLGGWRLLADLCADTTSASRVVLAVYFATPLWFYSRTFFTEPYVWSLTVLAVLALRRRRTATAALLLALALLVKEVALLLVAPIVIATAILRGRRTALLLAVGPGLAAVVYALKNLAVYGSPLVTYQPFTTGAFGRGLAGVLLDPRHGLLPFAPVLVVAAGGWLLRGAEPAVRQLLPFAAAVIAAYVAVTALWIDWRGGACFGPRLLVPAIAAFALPLLVVEKRAGHDRRLRLLAEITIAAGFAIQLAAAVNPFRAMWSPSVAELVTAQPAAVAAGLVVSTLLLAALRRWPPPASWHRP